MSRDELRAVGDELLAQAHVLCGADPGARFELPVREVPPDAPGCPVRAALAFLRDEMLRVRAGRAGGLVVLVDKMAHARQQLGVA